jgi:Ca2+-binding EF-hand superfamily protein
LHDDVEVVSAKVSLSRSVTQHRKAIFDGNSLTQFDQEDRGGSSSSKREEKGKPRQIDPADRMSATQSSFGFSNGFHRREWPGKLPPSMTSTLSSSSRFGRPWLSDPWCKLNPYGGKEKMDIKPSVPRDDLQRNQATTILQSTATMLPMLRLPQAHSIKPLPPPNPLAKKPKLADDKAPKRHRVTEISPVEKKINAAKTLARDRATCAASKEKKSQEDPKVTKARHQPIEDRMWEDVFYPLTKPQDNLPKVYRAHPPLPAPAVPRPLERKYDLLGSTEAEGLLYVCKEFAGLVKPHVADSNGQESWDTLVLTRPAFCRMLIALRLCGANGCPVYNRACVLFDSIAEKFPVKGSTNPTGSMFGLMLDSKRAGFKPPARDLPVSELFCVILEEIATATRGTLPVVERLAFVKKLFFTEQLPRAGGHANNRLNELQKLLCLGQEVSGPKGKRNSIAPGMDPAADIFFQDTRAESKQSNGSKEGPPDATKEQENEPQPEEDEGNDMEVGDACTTSQAAEKQSEKAKLYAHTFAVTKGELLTSMLMEPEVLQFTAQFDEAFTNIFRAYSDVPTSFIDDEGVNGHLSICAFIRFCVDFHLFPEIIDFCTMQSLYHSAECWQDISKGSIMDKLAMPEEKRPVKVGEPVELANPTSRKGCLGRGEIGLVIECGDQNCLVQDSRRRRAWYPYQLLVMSLQPYIVKGDKENGSGRSCGRLEWIQKDFLAMSKSELECLSLISAIDDWMRDHRKRARDVFGILDQDESGSLDCYEFLKGISFMRLENTPELSDVESMIALIDPDANGSVDIWEFDTVLLICRERKTRHKKAENFFMKEDSEMSKGELIASRYFNHLNACLDSRSWNAKDFFKMFDANKSDALAPDEFLAAGQQLGFPSDVMSGPDEFTKSLRMVDPNFDGVITLKELHSILARVKEAKNQRENVSAEPMNSFLALQHDPDSLVRIFGKRAFTETLLKIGLVHNNFHGKLLQADQMAHTKVLWLICYLNHQFHIHRLKYKVTNTLEGNALSGIAHEAEHNTSKWHKQTEDEKKKDNLGETIAEFKKMGLEVKQEGSKEKPDEAGKSNESPGNERNSKVTMSSPKCSPREARAQRKRGAEQALKEKAAWGRARLRSYVKKRGYAKYLTPLRRLMVEFPNLFNEVPSQVPEPLVSIQAGKVCADCGVPSYRGWGNVFCPTCCHADGVLHACLETQSPADFPALVPLFRED